MLLVPKNNPTRSIACLTLVCCTLLIETNLSAQNEASAKSEEIKTLGSPTKYESLSKEKKESLRKILMEAASLLNGIRVQESLEKIIEAENMVSDFGPLYNLKGAAYTKIRDFDKAQAAFERAVALNPKAVMTKFNLTEIHFVKKNYPLADKEFTKFLSLNKGLPKETKALVKYKVLICSLKQEKEAPAKEILKGFDYLDDHPAFYYSNAAIHFNKGEIIKANSWINAASKIYKPAINDVYNDSLIEAGWLENIE
ncbi:tetratricopeptide repeat protein [Verrucomicrobiales bacterium]|nr:tetratricopeptide repeat protein [Verrucomicrobiales bacterium]